MLDQQLDASRIRVLVDPVEGRHLAALRVVGDQLVRPDHELLDEAVGLGLRNGPRGGDVAVPVEVELGLRGLDLEGGALAQLGKGSRDFSSEPQRLGDLRWRFLAAGEHTVELVVVEAGVGANERAGEGDGADRPAPVQMDLRGHGEALHARRQAAGTVAQLGRQHRLHGAGHVHARRALCRNPLDPPSGPDVSGDVGDVDRQHDAVSRPLGRDRIVEVARRCGVDGEGGQRGEVAAGARVTARPLRGVMRFVQDGLREAPAQAAVGDQRRHHVRSSVGTAEDPQGARAVRCEVREDEVPG